MNCSNAAIYAGKLNACSLAAAFTLSSELMAERHDMGIGVVNRAEQQLRAQQL